MYDGIVLAGGFSKRANTNKMLLDYNGKTLIQNTIETMHKVCQNIIVVTGFYHNDMKSIISKIDYVKIVYNKDYINGMFSSIKTGVSTTKNDFFIIPGDYPLVSIDTYNKMIEEDKDIVVPSFNKKLGHPIFFNKKFKEKIINTKFDNLKDFRNNYVFKIINVNDSGILFDIDSMEDYKKLIGKE